MKIYFWYEECSFSDHDKGEAGSKMTTKTTKQSSIFNLEYSKFATN